jgi:hypothetical protein
MRRIFPGCRTAAALSTNSISRGTSYAARRSRTSAFSSAPAPSDGGRDDERLDRLAAHLVRDADHRRQRHGRVADEALLDLARADAVAGARDQVVGAADEAVVALVVDLGEVARCAGGRRAPSPRLRLVPPVAEEDDRVSLDATVTSPSTRRSS